MKVIVDAMGGDNAPIEILKGCAMASEEYGIEILLSGDKDIIKKCISENQIPSDNFSYLDCKDTITMEDHPDSILKEHKECSMAAALRAVAEDKGDALISAGNTGALVVGSTMYVKRIKGVKRAALAPLLPTDGDQDVLLLDCGANVECSAEMLRQFAVMGNEYAKSVLCLKEPRIALLNIGTEDTKGGPLQRDTFELLKMADLNFIGNIEARDVLPGVCDVVVTDGYNGNVFLKATEGACMVMIKNLKSILKKNIATKVGAIPMMGGFKNLAEKLDYTERGGAPLLGISKPIIKAHGNSKAKAFKNGIKQAINFAESGAIERITEIIKAD